MDHKDLLTIIGWPVTFLMGMSSALLAFRLTRKRQLLAWAITDETEIIPRELSKSLGLPVSIQVGDATPASL